MRAFLFLEREFERHFLFIESGRQTMQASPEAFHLLREASSFFIREMRIFQSFHCSLYFSRAFCRDIE